MANVFLNGADRDIETAIMLENANVLDIGKAVAYTDGDRIFINTDDNLDEILPDYNKGMLKWLLWHERYHMELRHHNRYYRYLDELNEKDIMDEFHVTKDEVNIIMDILVHDSLSKLFPELVETAMKNFAQMRNRNSLKYTFTTFTLEEMLEEYAKYKRDNAEDSDHKETGDGGEDKEESEDTKEEDSTPEGESKSEHKESDEKPSKPDKKKKDRPENEEPEVKPDTPAPLPDEHDKTDWSKLEDIDTREFIEKDEGDEYIYQINRLKRMKARLAKLTETLNGLVTSTRKRSYTMPSTVYVGGGVMLKGSTPGKTALYLCFDASGSMGAELDTFKDIISKSIPQAMDTPTEWFSGYNPSETDKVRNPKGRNYDYYKGKFKDIMSTRASSGYNDDGDRTIELCYLAEQQGFTPIGVTDGGGQISWSKDMIKKLQRTILVGQSEYWLKKVKEINPRIQTINI